MLCLAYSFICWHLLGHNSFLLMPRWGHSSCWHQHCWHLLVTPLTLEARVLSILSSSAWPQHSFGSISLLLCHSFPFERLWKTLGSSPCPSEGLSQACPTLDLPPPLYSCCRIKGKSHIWLVLVTCLSLTSHCYLELSKFSGGSLVGHSAHTSWS